MTRSIPLVSPFGPTCGRSISHLPRRSIVVKNLLHSLPLTRHSLRHSTSIASLLEVGTGFHPELTGRPC
ncbi:MAG: hypothetical protein ACKOHM_02295 [Spartobacteria bacterium]